MTERGNLVVDVVNLLTSDVCQMHRSSRVGHGVQLSPSSWGELPIPKGSFAHLCKVHMLCRALFNQSSLARPLQRKGCPTRRRIERQGPARKVFLPR